MQISGVACGWPAAGAGSGQCLAAPDEAGATPAERRRSARSLEDPPSQLAIEITETTLQDVGGVPCDPAGLRSLGVTVAIDDFGTGYSCLSSLKALADRSGEDRPRVRERRAERPQRCGDRRGDHRHDPQSQAHRRRGGRGDRGAGGFLFARGCDEAQGFRYARPMSAEALRRFSSARPRPLLAGARWFPCRLGRSVGRDRDLQGGEHVDPTRSGCREGYLASEGSKDSQSLAKTPRPDLNQAKQTRAEESSGVASAYGVYHELRAGIKLPPVDRGRDRTPPGRSGRANAIIGTMRGLPPDSEHSTPGLSSSRLCRRRRDLASIFGRREQTRGSSAARARPTRARDRVLGPSTCDPAAEAARRRGARSRDPAGDERRPGAALAGQGRGRDRRWAAGRCADRGAGPAAPLLRPPRRGSLDDLRYRWRGGVGRRVAVPARRRASDHGPSQGFHRRPGCSA